MVLSNAATRAIIAASRAALIRKLVVMVQAAMLRPVRKRIADAKPAPATDINRSIFRFRSYYVSIGTRFKTLVTKYFLDEARIRIELGRHRHRQAHET